MCQSLCHQAAHPCPATIHIAWLWSSVNFATRCEVQPNDVGASHAVDCECCHLTLSFYLCCCLFLMLLFLLNSKFPTHHLQQLLLHFKSVCASMLSSMSESTCEGKCSSAVLDLCLLSCSIDILGRLYTHYHSSPSPHGHHAWPYRHLPNHMWKCV